MGVYDERSYDELDQSKDSFETILHPQSNVDYNEGATIEHKIYLIHQYCHQLLKDSHLWFLEEDNIYIMADYKVNIG